MANNLSHDTPAQPSEEEQSGGLLGCLAGGALLGVKGVQLGAKYGYNTGSVGSFGRGGWQAFATVAGTTVVGAVVGGATLGAIGCTAGYKGERFLMEEIDKIPTSPMPTPQLLNPAIPENGRNRT